MIERVWPECLHCGFSFSCFPGELWPFQRSFYTAVQHSGVSTPQSQHSGVPAPRSQHSGVSTPRFNEAEFIHRSRNTAEFLHRSSVQFLKEVEWLVISGQRDFTTSNTAFQLNTRGEKRRKPTSNYSGQLRFLCAADLGTSKTQPEEIKLSLAGRQASLEVARDELSSNQHILPSL